ncbi:hypothetical protein [Nonomuraea sp. NEAU-A123]|nr:hypothetical protein [Nonomuraea sp. NEAU-A123]
MALVMFRDEVARYNAAPSHHFRGLIAHPVVSFVKLVPLVGG